ncbi:DUF3019 domain-containing protein [Alteromonas gilva]|uniref:DUF3019 domain-containing protein n=1 Tax=Alteromonas gilva TaxID=2987522 RepID=A0ABT5L3G3_9ALTE|nr:DUF3019 domain-containing protein [Alteromonas gilva]MDC8831589.1 DUF3019 domain-containing protein [Alteromonas gilva]
MGYLRLFIFLLSAYHMDVLANDVSFSVSPSECITAEKGDVCAMSLSIVYPRLSPGDYCVILNDTSLGCWQYANLPESLDVKIETESVLSLVDEDNTFRTSTLLKLRYRSATMLRRRVRNPWSLF